MVPLFSSSEEESQDLRIVCGAQTIIRRVCRLPEQDGAEEARQFSSTLPAKNIRCFAGILQQSVKCNRVGNVRPEAYQRD
eukprot:8976668-Pyramimonas_sp.AAC.1